MHDRTDEAPDIEAAVKAWRGAAPSGNALPLRQRFQRVQDGFHRGHLPVGAGLRGVTHRGHSQPAPAAYHLP